MAEELEVSIRYEGLGENSHELDLFQLGVSLQGFARVLAVCGNFVHTGNYNKQFGALSVHVVAKEPPDHHCYEVVATIKAFVTSKDFWVGAGGPLLVVVLQYVFGRRRGEEMKLLKDALDKSIQANARANERLIETIEKMADALRPGIRQALEPIGRSAKEIDLYSGMNRVVGLNEDDKARFLAEQVARFEPTRQFNGVISEMDMKQGTCKVSLDDDEGRIPAEITDPIRSQPNNPYAVAMAQTRPLSFMAKAEVDEEGNVVKLFISDVAPEQRP